MNIGSLSVCIWVISHQVSSVIASVEDTLGLPSPHELAKEEEEESEQVNEETSRLAAGEGGEGESGNKTSVCSE